MEKKLKDSLTSTNLKFMSNDRISFFSGVLLRCNQTWDEEIPTAATCGRDIYINPDFFLSLNDDERVFLMFHEVAHIFLDHLPRKGDFDPQVWNIAADYKVNQLAEECGLSLIKNSFRDSSFDDMTTEQVYKEIYEETKEKDIQTNDCLYQKDSDMEDEELKKYIDDMVLDAYTSSEMSGKGEFIPPSIRELVLEIKNPTIPWHQILFNLAICIGQDDYSYLVRDRRYDEFYLPDLISEKHESPAIYIDCSGSTYESAYKKQIEETHALWVIANPEHIDIIHFDDKIMDRHRVHNIREMNDIVFHSGGWTDIDPVIADIKETKPKLAIIFTDGYFGFSQESSIPPQIPVFWIIVENPKFDPPYGKVIHIKEL